jgi:hypothetical protein
MAARRDYIKLTGGWWLGHAPESFLQMVVAKTIRESVDNAVYIDVLLQQIGKETILGVGRPAGKARQRPDIAKWYKSSDTLLAVIEIKKNYRSQPIADDAQKLGKMMKHHPWLAAADILGYAES